VRCPAHPVALRLLAAARAAGIDGIVAPSANRFGRISPTTAAHVREELGEAVAVVLDGGPCAVGIESTIVDVSGAAPRVLRPGMITEAAIAECLGTPLGAADASAPRVSGALPAHYAPRTPLLLLAAADCAPRVLARLTTGAHIALLASRAVVQAVGAHAALRSVIAAADADGYARTLYANLRALDAADCTLIVIEATPSAEAWRGIADRLQRAAQGHSLPPA
jgi:L-threonylcarbamoyladenylate synthase